MIIIDIFRRAKELEPVSGDMLFEFIAPEGLRELTRICMLLLRKKYLISRQRLVVTSRKGTDSGTEKDSLSGELSENQHTIWQLNSFKNYLFSLIDLSYNPRCKGTSQL